MEIKSEQPAKALNRADRPDPLVIGGKELASRFLLGTGKFKNKAEVRECIQASGTQLVTVALRRIDLNRHEDNILEYLPPGITLLTNTSGARTADEAVRLARLAREAGYGTWIKVEVINDSKYLLPDNLETVKATEILVKEGFTVLPYILPDLNIARTLVQAGAATVMPLGSLIGSNQGLRVKDLIQILIEEIEIPVVVDAGIGSPSQACEAMEMGADAVLVNTAVATAGDPTGLAKAFALAIQAGRRAYLSQPPEPHPFAKASSPLTGFLYNESTAD
ncbi:MAG: thiazole synthase [Candidatus Omnitrophota bacterium]|jgi:thiazole synthase